MPKKLLAFLLLAALLLSGCASGAEETDYALTLWVVEGDPLAPALERLAADWNGARPRDSLPLTLRAFESEERLLAALQSGAAPALALLGHEDAFALAEAGLLFDPGLSPDYPAWLRARAGCVGHGFYPLGFALPLLRFAESESFSALLYIGAFAPLFRQALWESGEAFTADFDGVHSESYVNLYNAVAEAAFSGFLSLSAEDTPAWALDLSPALRGRDTAGAEYSALSEAKPLAEGRGLAVTARDARMRRALDALLRFLFEGERLPAAALDAGLVPASPLDREAADALGAALLSLAGQELTLPADTAYARNRAGFEARIREALSLLR